MKIQFGISGLLLASAAIAISLGSVLGVRQIRNPSIPIYAYFVEFQCSAPYWLPIVFLAYFIGRRELKALTVLTFAILEAAALGWVYIAMTYFPHLGEIGSS